MAESVSDYPYERRLNILYSPLETIDEQSIADGCEYKWFNQTLCQVNGGVVRMAKRAAASRQRPAVESLAGDGSSPGRTRRNESKTRIIQQKQEKTNERIR